MNPHVTIQIARLGEPEAAKAALVGFLPGVNPQVLRQRARIGEGLLALPTPATLSGHFWYDYYFIPINFQYLSPQQ